MKIHVMRALARPNRPLSTRQISRLQRQLSVAEQTASCCSNGTQTRGVAVFQRCDAGNRSNDGSQSTLLCLPSSAIKRRLSCFRQHKRDASRQLHTLEEIARDVNAPPAPSRSGSTRRIDRQDVFKVPIVSSSDDAGCRHSDNHFVAASTRTTVRATMTSMR